MRQQKLAIIRKKLGDKAKTMIYAKEGDDETTVINTDTPPTKREQFVLNDEEVNKIARWSLQIEEHYKKPMDIEWAKDGNYE